MEKKKCKLCKKEFKDYNKIKIFCTTLCSTRFHAKRQYERSKNDPKYKKEAYERLKKWIEKNKEHHRKYMRNYMNNVVGQKYYYKDREKKRERRNQLNMESYYRCKLRIQKMKRGEKK